MPLGKYQVVEVSYPQGYVLDSTPYDFEITQRSHNNNLYNLMNKQIKLLR
ncbi:MAG: prealbumin-like fold domain-containing protein [Faecalibacillus faecis]